MARPSKVDPCMFCGEAPCACNKKEPAAKKSAPRKRAVPIVSKQAAGPAEGAAKAAPGKKADARAAMMTAVAAAKKNPVREPPKEMTHDEMSHDPEMIAALQAVEPLMHPMERKRFASELAHQLEPSERATLWRKRVNND